LGVVRPTEKHCVTAAVYTAKEINNSISVTAAADCIAPDWPVSHSDGCCQFSFSFFPRLFEVRPHAGKWQMSIMAWMFS